MMGTDTQSYKEIKKRNVCLNPTRAARLLSVVADKFPAEMRVVKEMLCCLSKDITKRNAEVEPYIHGQSYWCLTGKAYLEIAEGSEQPAPYIIPIRLVTCPHDLQTG